MSLLEELDIEVYNQLYSGSKVWHSNNNVITKYSGEIPQVSYIAVLDLLWSIYKVSCRQLCQLDSLSSCLLKAN